MRINVRRASVLIALLALLSACATPTAPAQPATGAASTPAPATPKRVALAIMGDPQIVLTELGLHNVPGTDGLQGLLHIGLARVTDQGTLAPSLAATLPTLENGLWQVMPDGRMQTTWKLKPGLVWQDGEAFTVQDLVFTAGVMRDSGFPIQPSAIYGALDTVSAPDDATVVASWTRPYIDADQLFTQFALPLPQHILGQPYTENRAGFVDLPYWSREFVGLGPFQLREWVPDSYLNLDAFAQYAEGRPRLDQLEVRLIPDPNALVASLLAGTVELTIGRSLSLEQAIEVRDQWHDGTMDVGLNNWIAIYPQFTGPDPAVVANVEFRRALMMAIDRQEMASSLEAGLSPVAEEIIGPSDPEHAATADRVVRYPYDPGQAEARLTALGYGRGSDGTLRDASGTPLSVEIRTTVPDDLQEKSVYSVADYWQRLGLTVTPQFVPPQRLTDLPYRATFPSFELVRQPNSLDALQGFTSDHTPLPENNFRTAGNRNRYMNPDFDALIARYFVTIPRDQRIAVLGDIIHVMTDQLTQMGLFYNIEPTMVGNRLVNVTERKASRSTQAWNAAAWDVRAE